jgi:general secretion pathway protein M
MNLPTGLRGRFTALGLLLFVIAVVVIALSPYWSKLATLKTEKETLTAQLQRFGKLASRLPELEKRIQHTNIQNAMRRYTLPGNTPSLAAAELQRILRNVAKKHNGQVNSAKTLPVTIEKGFELIPVNIKIDIPLSGLQAMLYEIDTMQPKLYIDNLRIMSNQPPSSRTRLKKSPITGTLKVTLRLHGIRTAHAK